MDAPSSFVYLVDNIPSWTTKISELSDYASKKNAEFVQEYTDLVKQIRPKRVKSPSLASIHPEDEIDAAAASVKTPSTEHLPILPPRVEIDPLEAGNRYLYAQANRKRKPDNSVKSGASGPQKFRSKHQVVIYYDAFLQAQLDTMVKSLGVARNNLRKGKNSLVAARGFQLPSLTRRFDGPYNAPSTENMRGIGMSKTSPMLLSGKLDKQIARQPARSDEAAFTQTDKELEAIQQVCETAAHQFLRDGDCKFELDTVVRRLGEVLLKAKDTAELLKKSSEQQETSDTGNDNLTSADQARTDSYTKLCASTSADVLKSDVTGKMTPSISPACGDMMATHSAIANILPASKSTEAPITGAVPIEVDSESDNSSILIDVGKYRLANDARLIS